MTTLSIGSVADSITAFFHDPKNTTVTRQRVKPKLPTNYRPPVLPFPDDVIEIDPSECYVSTYRFFMLIAT